eukprot:1185803-Prorocentrum_minimum.AAC.1
MVWTAGGALDAAAEADHQEGGDSRRGDGGARGGGTHQRLQQGAQGAVRGQGRGVAAADGQRAITGHIVYTLPLLRVVYEWGRSPPASTTRCSRSCVWSRAGSGHTVYTLPLLRVVYEGGTHR